MNINGTILKKEVAMSIAVRLILSIVLLLIIPSDISAQMKKMLIIDSQSGEPYSTSTDAMIDELRTGGYEECKNLSITRYNIQNREDMGIRTLKSEAEKGYDVIFTNGTIANIAAFKVGYKNPDYKFVFCNITDPVGVGVVRSLDKPTDSNFTGVGFTVPVAERLRFLREVLPGAKKIGMIYADMPQSHSYIEWLKSTLQLKEFSDMELILRKVEFIEGDMGSKQMAQLAKNHILTLNDSVDVYMTPSDQMGTQRYFAETVAEFGTKPLLGLTGKEINEDWGACFALFSDQTLAGREAGGIRIQPVQEPHPLLGQGYGRIGDSGERCPV